MNNKSFNSLNHIKFIKQLIEKDFIEIFYIFNSFVDLFIRCQEDGRQQ